MKCSIMLHFIRVYTVCKGKKDLQTKENNIFGKLYPGSPRCLNGLPQVYVSNQKKESISVQKG